MMKEITQGQAAEWGFGFCWFNYNRLTITVAPIPFNFIFRWTRELYFYLASPARAKHEEEIRNQIHSKYSEGYDDGEKAARVYVIKEVGKALGNGITGLEELIDKWVKDGFYFDR